MKHHFIDFQQQLMNEIETLTSVTSSSTSFLKEAFEIVKKETFAMKEWQRTYEFQNEEEEKHFYKTTRPNVIAYFKYYQTLCEWDLKAPLTDVEQVAYYDEKHKMVTDKLNRLGHVKSYLQTEESEQYAINDVLEASDCGVTKNWRPCIQNCLPLAEYISYGLQLDYLKETYSMLHSQTLAVNDKLHWDENLVDLSEIIFAIYHSNAINSSTISLKRVAVAFESIFDIKISDNLNNRWRDIVKRKHDHARFLKKMVYIIEDKVGKTS